MKIIPAHRGARLRQFIRLPERVYADDPHWVRPLYWERRLHFSSLNPFFRHGRWAAWLACRGGEPVGRISAQIDDLHRKQHGVLSGHFGLLEARRDHAVFAALFATAENWLRRRDARVVTGPFGLSINQESGLLVRGFDTPPVIMMPHGRPWYDEMVRRCGYRKARDLYAYRIAVRFDRPPVMRALLRKHGDRVRLRPLDRRRFKQDLRLIRDIFNDAWAANWGFAPMTEAEIDELGTALRLFVPDDFIRIAEVDGRAAAFMVALPNLHESLRKMNGRLFPTGLFKLARDIRRNRIKSGRIPLMGVRRIFHGAPLGMALAFMVIDALRQPVYDKGIREVEMSWILEDNRGMRAILDAIGARLYKTYRVYEKRLETEA